MPARHSGEFNRWMMALNAHLEGARPDPDLPLDVSGTTFQLRVWRYLRRIPPGAVRTYAEVAAGIATTGRTGRILRSSGAGADHPVHPLLPESAYLKLQALQLD